MTDLKLTAREIALKALSQCSIARAVQRNVRTEVIDGRNLLFLRDHAPIDLDRLNRVRIVAAGKAAAPMLEALMPYLPLPSSCDLRGVVIGPRMPESLPSSLHFFAGGHPVPNQASFDGAEEALKVLQDVQNSPPDETLCIFLISGGASSMMELPLDPSISLPETVTFHQVLVASGANIVEMNCVRKHFSAVKGGRLARAAGSARKISLLISDVPPEHLDALGSGPTIPDSTTVADCHEILERYELLDRFPAHVRSFFTWSNLPETPKPGELISPCWKLLDSEELGLAAQRESESLGFHTVVDNTCDDWPYDQAADYLLGALDRLRSKDPRACIVSCGEVTVKLPPSLITEVSDTAREPAVGGRNQHFALYAATRAMSESRPLAVLSIGSDGIDGNSVAAGAVVDGDTIRDAIEHHSSEEPDIALRRFDSFSWLDAVGATIKTGPTGQNLRDLRILLAEP